ncbi:MAG TPA: SDR family NAD(P)-dependent oxidoreductase [Gaiellaceae bacterium]|nr:SDR family NAD(P)-dependent oxidoreductase [Gaiellaceae bacterium]
MGKLDNRVAIVTGAAQGIGKAVADKLEAEGATVVGVDLKAGTTIQADISKEDDVRRMVDEVVSQHDRLDVLVNVAAIVPFTPWDEIDFAEWRRIMSVNLDGTFLTNHHAQKAMRANGYGRIVNIASNVVLAGTPNLAHYVASKGGVVAFTRALARELGPHGITVNAVAPGLTETEGVLASKHAEAFDFVQMLQCIPRRAVAADIAPAVAFLASEEAGWITGQLLVADGGHTHN